ncbi:MAG: hypothetical protein ACLFV7_05600 [Phycisphaerae bacterium]
MQINLKTYSRAVRTFFLLIWITVVLAMLTFYNLIPQDAGFVTVTVLFAAVFVAVTVFALGVNFRMFHITCPFCRREGKLMLRGRTYTYFRCPSCGDIHGMGLLRNRLERADPPPSAAKDEDGHSRNE